MPTKFTLALCSALYRASRFPSSVKHQYRQYRKQLTHAPVYSPLPHKPPTELPCRHTHPCPTSGSIAAPCHHNRVQQVTSPRNAYSLSKTEGCSNTEKAWPWPPCGYDTTLQLTHPHTVHNPTIFTDHSDMYTHMHTKYVWVGKRQPQPCVGLSY